MKTGIHPEYRAVVVRDRPAGYGFLTRSTRTPTTTLAWEDEQEYPGRARTLDTTGRVGMFERRYCTRRPR